ncbi:MAG: tRNA-dihydrouridine synthase family protein [Pseudomonadota bacterium]
MLIFPRKLIQAPLAGYSCAPFRVLAEQWGKPDFSCSEMLSAHHIFSGARQKERYHYKSPHEGKLCVQLAGDEAHILAYAAQQAVSWGADFIDLNCGCPQPKIRKKNFGSRLLSNSEHLYHLVSALKAAVNVPVLVKIRVDAESGDRYNQDVAQAIEAAGANALTVHGRHWTHDYDIPVNYHEIATIKASVKIPVIGNGDITDTASAQKMFSETGCDAVMIARASVGQPWLFEKIHQELQGNVFIPPSLAEIGEIFLSHVRGLTELESEKSALLQSRSLGKYYARDYFDRIPFLQAMGEVKTYDNLAEIVKKYFTK